MQNRILCNQTKASLCPDFQGSPFQMELNLWPRPTDSTEHDESPNALIMNCIYRQVSKIQFRLEYKSLNPVALYIIWITSN